MSISNRTQEKKPIILFSAEAVAINAIADQLIKESRENIEKAKSEIRKKNDIDKNLDQIDKWEKIESNAKATKNYQSTQITLGAMMDKIIANIPNEIAAFILDEIKQLYKISTASTNLTSSTSYQQMIRERILEGKNNWRDNITFSLIDEITNLIITLIPSNENIELNKSDRESSIAQIQKAILRLENLSTDKYQPLSSEQKPTEEDILKAIQNYEPFKTIHKTALIEINKLLKMCRDWLSNTDSIFSQDQFKKYLPMFDLILKQGTVQRIINAVVDYCEHTYTEYTEKSKRLKEIEFESKVVLIDSKSSKQLTSQGLFSQTTKPISTTNTQEKEKHSELKAS